MTSADTWGFSLKLAVWTVAVASVTMMLVAAGAGGEPGGIDSILILLSLLLAIVSALAVPVLVWSDARALGEEGRWNSRPRVWGVGSVLVPVLPLLYLGLRRRRVGDTGTPLRAGVAALSTRARSTFSRESPTRPETGGPEVASPVGKWGFRLKSALATAGVSLALLTGVLGSALAALGSMLFFGSYLALVGFVWRDAEAVRETGEWEPEPERWAVLTLFFVGLPALVYLRVRRRHVADTGPPLVSALSRLGERSVDRLRRPRSSPNVASDADRWILRLKGASVVLLTSFVLLSASPSDSGLADIAGDVMVLSLPVAAVFVWYDARAVRETEEWTPRAWLWALASVLFYPAFLYLGYRYYRVGDLGPSLRGWVSAAVPLSEFRDSTTDDDTQGTPDATRSRDAGRSRDATQSRDAERSPPSADALERGDSEFDRGRDLVDREQYHEAHAAFEDARSAYEQAKAAAADSSHSERADIASRIDRTDRSIERCWVSALEERLETAEAHLSRGEVTEAHSSFEKARAVLDGRTFEYTDVGMLEHRARNGLEACATE